MRIRRAPAALLAATFLTGCNGGGSGSPSSDPKLETDAATLDAALKCTGFTHPDKPAVLLVHGTFTAGFEQYDWTYIPLLDARGYDVCAVTYPDRGLGDMQVSAEYVVHAIRRVHERSGRRIAMIGHSQGVAVPRWAIKWWASAREAVEDFVMQAGPCHGTTRAAAADLVPSVLDLLGLPSLPVGLLPEVFYQFPPDSNFIAATNRDDETPGDIDYTTLYTQFDELVQPVSPVPTAAVDFGQGNPRVANILLQDVCPGRFVDHVTIGLTDRLAFDLTMDAIGHDGPADVARAGGDALCGGLPIVPDQIVASDAASAFLGILRQDAANGAPDPHLASGEPALRDYAQP